MKRCIAVCLVVALLCCLCSCADSEPNTGLGNGWEPQSTMELQYATQFEVDCYEGANWQYPAPDSEVMVLHTLVIDPHAARQGLGQDFVAFYEAYAREKGCPFLRMDTNVRNTRARALYKKLGYTEPDIVPCVFNGIPGVRLVLLEKKL